VAGGDGRLERVRPKGAAGALRAIERGKAAPDQQPVPARPVLVEQQHRFPGGADPRAGARCVQLHQGDEAVDLRFRGEQLGEDAAEPQRLLDQLGPHPVLAGGRRVALVEDEVDRLEHGGETVGELVALGHLERHPRLRERALGAHDPLRDRRLRDQVRASDLPRRQAGEQAQRERHPRIGREHRMAGREDQAQEIVVERIVDPRLKIGVLDLAADLDLQRELSRLSLVHLGSAQAVDRPVLGRAHQPGARVVRYA
jgi:hypothetical protein